MKKVRESLLTGIFLLFQLIPFIVLFILVHLNSDNCLKPTFWIAIIVSVVSFVIREIYQEEFHWLADIFIIIFLAMDITLVGFVLFYEYVFL